MDFPKFDYSLIQIKQYNPEIVDEKDFFHASFRHEHFIYNRDTLKYEITIRSWAYASFNEKYNVYIGESIYIMNQEPFRNMIVELIYQHLSRQSSDIYNLTDRTILLKVPTMFEIYNSTFLS